MLLTASKLFRSTIVLVALLLPCRPAQGLNLFLGVDGAIDRVSQGNSDDSGKAIYSGIGYGAEIRLGLGKNKLQTKAFQLEPFASYYKTSQSNINSAVRETYSKSALCLGADARYGIYFAGAVCELTTADIVADGTLSATLKFPQIGLRGGIVIGPSTSHFSVMVGTQVGMGNSTFKSETGADLASKALEFRGFVTLRYNFFPAHPFNSFQK